MAAPVPPETRAAALDRLRAGDKLGDVARDLEVNPSTVSRWAKAAGITVVTSEQTANATRAAQTKWAERRGTLTDRFGEVAEALLERVLESDPGDMRHLMWSAAVAVDKAQLLSGAPTQRHEVRDVERRRDRVTSMTDELEERRQAKAG